MTIKGACSNFESGLFPYSSHLNDYDTQYTLLIKDTQM